MQSVLTFTSSNNISLYIYSYDKSLIEFKVIKTFTSSKEIFKFYINDSLVLTENTTDDDWKSFQFEIHKGYNKFTFEHILNEPKYSFEKKSIVKISDIVIPNADPSAFYCEKPKISDIDFDVNEENSICSDNNYYKEYTNKCDISTLEEKVIYSLISSAKCPKKTEEKIIVNIPCRECFQGQYTNFIKNNSYKCEYCPEGTYLENYIHENACRKCNGIISKVFYYYPPNDNIANINFTIIDEIGYIEFYLIKRIWQIDSIAYIEIDDKLNEYRTNEIPKIEIYKGKHYINIHTVNFIIEKIIIRNSNLGGGYKCIIKDNSPLNYDNNVLYLQVLVDNKNCSEREEDFYFSNITQQCIKCPLNTHKIEIFKDNERIITSKTTCFFDNIINLSKFKRGYYLSKLALYFENKEPIKAGGNINLHLGYFPQIKKDDIILGEELKKLKIVHSDNIRGIIAEYQSNSKCDDDQSELYKSFVFFECDPLMKNPYLETTTKQNCNYYFTIKTLYACPICLDKEVKLYHLLNKIKFKRKNKSLCMIPDDGMLINHLNLFTEKENNELYLNSKSRNEYDKELIDVFQIKKNVPFFTKENNNYYQFILFHELSKSSKEFSILLVPFVLLILIVVICFVYGYSNYKKEKKKQNIKSFIELRNF